MLHTKRPLRRASSPFLFRPQQFLSPAFFADQNHSHRLVTFDAAILLMRCLGRWRETHIATRSMAARFFGTVVFGIALARAFRGVDHLVLLRLTAFPITLALGLTIPLAEIRGPVLLIGQPPSPSPSRLHAGLRAIPIQVMTRQKVRFASLEQATACRHATVLRGIVFATTINRLAQGTSVHGSRARRHPWR